MRLLPIELPFPVEASKQYELLKYVVARGMITAEKASELIDLSQGTESIGVYHNDPNISWREQRFTQGHPVYEFFEQLVLVAYVKGLELKFTLTQTIAWTSIYSKGQFINAHNDASGSIQLVICLKSPNDEKNGGHLCLGSERIFLRPGDAIFYKATDIEHYTTPLVPTAEDDDPSRTVIDCRYYLD